MWFLYAFGGAFFKSLSGYYRKKASYVSSSVLTLYNCAILLLVLLPFVIYFHLPVFTFICSEFFLVIGLALTGLLGLVFNIKALSKDELSFVAPLNGFIPVIALVGAWLFLGELPSYMGILFVFLIFLGTYVMALEPSRVRWYDPLTHLARSRGAQLSLLVAVLYAANTILIKFASDKGYDPVTILYASDLVGIVMFLYIFFTKERKTVITSLRKEPIAVVGASLSSLFGSLSHNAAVSLTFASYALAIRRFDTVFSVILGWKFLKETNIRNKLVGASIITLGSALLALFA